MLNYLHSDFFFFELQALAGTIDKEELADLRDQFDAIDVDKSGAISLEEMRQVNWFSFSDVKISLCVYRSRII